MKKVLLILLAIVAMAGTSVDAKSISKTPVGCWTYTEDVEPMSFHAGKDDQDTLLTYYRTNFDSLTLCKDNLGVLEYHITRRYFASTEDGYVKVIENAYEYTIHFKWKYQKGYVKILACSPNISCVHVKKTSDNRGGEYPSHFDSNYDEEAAKQMIDMLPQLKLEYNPANGRLYSHGLKAYFRRRDGKPIFPISIKDLI